MTQQDVEHEHEAETEDEPSTKRRGKKKRHDEHLRDVDVGAGCTEIWEHLSDQRDEE
ncbi:hypothetical protein [Haloarchaeobius sp. DYHT-AS-18]|uniref:hypothetical protein n=1 Tax=Haloarchaeobius sp. DYHT-AS-18 TaxID=3446117 RepID=UPI003EBC7301